MKKIIIFIGIIGFFLILAYQSTIIPKGVFVEDDEEGTAFQSISPYDHQTKPFRLKSLDHIDFYSHDYPFRDAKIENHDEALLNKRTTRYRVELDEPETLIPHSSVTPKTPAPYPLEKQLSD